MALNERRTWLIAYDIREPRRLNRLHRFIVQHAVMVQYSVYLFEGHGGELSRLLSGIRKLIDQRVDDVRVYPVPDRPEIHTLGRGTLPAETWLVPETTPRMGRLL